jgi:phage anti-repressor protein
MSNSICDRDFSLTTADFLYASDNPFPVKFDLAWQWLGYAHKRDAKQFILKNFEESVDYQVLQPRLGTLDDPRPKEQIYLTVEAFKTWGMLAGTEQGKLVRKYFLECEKIAKEKKKPLSLAEIVLQQAQMAVETERQLAAQDRRLEAIEQRQQEALAKLKQLPPASVEVEPLTTRFALGRLVRDYAIANNLEYATCWTRLYMEHRDRTHIDLKARARNHKPKMSCCEYGEKYGYIEQLYAIALELFS